MRAATAFRRHHSGAGVCGAPGAVDRPACSACYSSLKARCAASVTPCSSRRAQTPWRPQRLACRQHLKTRSPIPRSPYKIKDSAQDEWSARMLRGSCCSAHRWNIKARSVRFCWAHRTQSGDSREPPAERLRQTRRPQFCTDCTEPRAAATGSGCGLLDRQAALRGLLFECGEHRRDSTAGRFLPAKARQSQRKIKRLLMRSLHKPTIASRSIS